MFVTKYGVPLSHSLESPAPAATPDKPILDQVMSAYQDIENDSAGVSSVLSGVTQAQQDEEKDGTYNDPAFREATVLWLSQCGSSTASASGQNRLDAAVSLGTQDQLNTLFSSPTALHDAATALKAPAGGGPPPASIEQVVTCYKALQANAHDSTRIANYHAALWSALQSAGVTSQMLGGQDGENQIYYQDYINTAMNQVLTVFQQAGASQSRLDSLSSSLPASMVVQQINQTLAASGSGNATVTAMGLLDDSLSGQPSSGAYYQAVMSDPAVKSFLQSATTLITQATQTATVSVGRG